MRIQVSARNRAFQFDSAPGERLLYAGLASAINLPYECGTGTCGTCKAKLIAGEVEDLWPEASGRKYLKQPGEYLMCQCVAKTDCSLEVGNFVYTMDPGACTPHHGSGVIKNVKTLAPDVMSFSLELDAPCDFDAGQFVVLEVPGVTGFRGYSMTNFERASRRLEFVIKRKPGGGATEWLFAGGAEGKQARWFGPLGTATFFPTLGKNILCIAGGSGIAGIMAILARAAHERYFDQYTGHVFFGVRTYADAFFLGELAALVSDFKDKLKVVVALSDEDVPAAAQSSHPKIAFDKGLVHEVAARHMQGRYQNVRAYLAGPPPAVDGAIRMLLLQAKLTADNIRYDKFS
jgi:toluene monooxygenase electron transfer component